MAGLVRTLVIALVVFGIAAALLSLADVRLTQNCDVADCWEAPGAEDEGFRVGYSYGLLVLLFVGALIVAVVVNLVAFRAVSSPKPLTTPPTLFGQCITTARQ
jgi:ABC-type antimicrobial peptide transport system permease subunit